MKLYSFLIQKFFSGVCNEPRGQRVSAFDARCNRSQNDCVH
jgi:hypothetical protein